MRREVIMVMGRWVWLRGAEGWRQESLPDSGTPLSVYLQGCIGRMNARQVALVYEPAGMGHQEVECPKASRTVFSSISRVRTEFPVVVSEDLGWGMEPPVPVAGGSYSTLIHFELSRCLAQAASRDGEGPEVVAAWSVFTLAESFLKGRVSDDASLLVLLPGFVALAVVARGRRNFRIWAQPMSDRDWRSLLFMTIGHAEPDEGRRGGAVAVVAEGDPAMICPCWEEMRNSSRLECLVGLEELAACAVGISARHPANLVLGFPTPVNLDPVITAAAVAALAASALVGTSLRAEATEFNRLEGESHTHVAEIHERVETLERNRSEIELVQAELPEARGAAPSARAAALRGLAAAIPDSITLTAFRVAGDDSFEMEATFVGREFEQESVRRALSQNGFSVTSPGSWSFDAASRRLSARGILKAPPK